MAGTTEKPPGGSMMRLGGVAIGDALLRAKATTEGDHAPTPLSNPKLFGGGRLGDATMGMWIGPREA